jgi:hypothetical protein
VKICHRRSIFVSIVGGLSFCAHQTLLDDAVILMLLLHHLDDRYSFVQIVVSTLLAAGDGPRQIYAGKTNVVKVTSHWRCD